MLRGRQHDVRSCHRPVETSRGTGWKECEIPVKSGPGDDVARLPENVHVHSDGAVKERSLLSRARRNLDAPHEISDPRDSFDALRAVEEGDVPFLVDNRAPKRPDYGKKGVGNGLQVLSPDPE